MSRYQPLSLGAQTAFSELTEAALVLETSRSVGSLHGAFAEKTVKGKTYWYFAYRDLDGRTKQLYVGPDNERVRKLIASAAQPKTRDLVPQARAARVLGCAPILARHFRIIRRLAEYEFFRAGGVLIGTHAFGALGNMLGVQLTDGAKTLDLDFAHAGKNISIALPTTLEINVQKAIDSLEMGFLPMTEVDGSPSATLANPREPEFRIDFLTCLGREKSKPTLAENLNIPLQPLEHLELILEAPEQTVVFCDEGAVVVNVPAPAALAVHKLIVATLRKGPGRSKARKDLAQSAALVEVLASTRPDELRAVWKDVLKRGPSWKKRAVDGLRQLKSLTPEVVGVEKLRHD